MKNTIIYIVTIVLALGCYTFKGISIDPEVSTFFVQNLNLIAGNAPPTLGIDFTERLKDKVRNETRLTLKNEAPDVEFSGEVTDFRVSPLAPKPGEVVGLNKLEIRIKLDYKNLKNPKKGWATARSFQHFAEFSSDADLLAVQDQLVKQIGDQLLEDIFNAAFNDW